MTRDYATGIIIDAEFQSMIPPLSADELAQLRQNIDADGCRDPLAVWPTTAGREDVYVLLDGHNRYAICNELGIGFDTVEIKGLANREDAADWIDRNQLGRRNLSPDQASLLRGRRYNRAKKARESNLKQNRPIPQSEGSEHTADLIAAQHGVSRATIERDGVFAAAVEKVKAVEPEIEKRVARGTDAPPKAAVVKAAQLLETAPDKAAAILRGETTTADAIREQRREEIRARLDDVAAVKAKAVAGVYDVLVIDPPWPMQKIERDVRPNQSEFDYPTMDEAELAALALPCAADAHVFCWTTHKHLPMALRLLDAWNLKYVCTFVWHKPGGFQPIGLPQYNCEFVLYARRGAPQFIDTKAFPVCFDAPRGAHSEKPDAFYDVIRRVTAGRRLDMFNRRVIDGFDGWGNEAA